MGRESNEVKVRSDLYMGKVSGKKSGRELPGVDGKGHSDSLNVRT